MCIMETNYITNGIIKTTDGIEETIHIPYNLNNILVTDKDIICILDKYNVNIDKINHSEYFIQAFTHKSYCNKNIFTESILSASRKELGNPANLIELQDTSYERWEFLGDRVLKLIVSTYLFDRYPKQDEGFMTRLQTKLEDKKNLAIMSKEMGLGKFFIICKQIENINGRHSDKIHEDVFESFIGALYKSNGYEPCLHLIVNLLETLIDYSDKLYCDNNYKDRLLRYHHQNKWPSPQYGIIYIEGQPPKRKYVMGVEHYNGSTIKNIEQKYVGFGVANIKKIGEQNAAKMALITYGILNNDQYNESDIFTPDWNKINMNIELKYVESKLNTTNIDSESEMSDKSVD
jgi:ribonuclease-3